MAKVDEIQCAIGSFGCTVGFLVLSLSAGAGPTPSDHYRVRVNVEEGRTSSEVVEVRDQETSRVLFD